MKSMQSEKGEASPLTLYFYFLHEIGKHWAIPYSLGVYDSTQACAMKWPNDGVRRTYPCP